jgi:hypothetical protein
MRAPVHWNDLPKFSAWPARLLGAEPFTPHQRTRQEVLREYDREKWGTVLQWLKNQSKFSQEDLLHQQGIDPEQICLFMVHDDFFAAPAREVMNSYDRLLLETLRAHEPETLVELGCGLGDKLLKATPELNTRQPYGGEFTNAGVECGRLLAVRQGIVARFEHFDYNDPQTLVPVPAGAVVFTSHSIEQIPDLSESFVEGLLRRSPKRVVHLEPCYEDQDETTLTGLMRRRYTELNDYNRNLVGLLRSLESRGRLRILEHRPNVFSDTPFNPTSILVWEPA